jgi:hypothetical protein
MVPNDDRVWEAIGAVRSGNFETTSAASDLVARAAEEAREAGQEAAALAAEAARSAAVAGMSHDAGAALHATGYCVAYAIQAANKVGAYDSAVMEIEKWLVTQFGRLKEVGH